MITFIKQLFCMHLRWNRCWEHFEYNTYNKAWIEPGQTVYHCTKCGKHIASYTEPISYIGK